MVNMNNFSLCSILLEATLAFEKMCWPRHKKVFRRSYKHNLQRVRNFGTKKHFNCIVVTFASVTRIILEDGLRQKIIWTDTCLGSQQSLRIQAWQTWSSNTLRVSCRWKILSRQKNFCDSECFKHFPNGIRNHAGPYLALVTNHQIFSKLHFSLSDIFLFYYKQ